MRRPDTRAIGPLVSGGLLITAVVWGLPPMGAVPVGAGLLVLLLVLVLLQRPVALTGLAMLVLPVAGVRQQLHPDLASAVTASALLLLLLLTSLPTTAGLHLRPRTVLAMTVAGAAIVTLLAALASSVAATGAVSYVLGLGATLLAYWLAMAPRHPAGEARGSAESRGA